MTVRFLIAAMFFLLVLAILAGTFAAVQAIRRRQKRRQLKALMGKSGEQALANRIQASRPAKSQLFGGVVDLARLETLLTSADVDVAPERFLILAMLFGCMCFLATWAVTRNVVGGFLFLILGACLPMAILIVKRRQRDEALVRQMPDALDMIVRALRVGQSVDNALKEAGHSCPPPLGTEIRTIYEEVALGIPFAVALRNFEGRFARLADVKLMTTAFIIQRETGGNLTQVLANLSDLIRERDTLQRQVMALTAEGRSSSMVLGLLPIGVGGFFWVAKPAYIAPLFSHPIGRKMLIAAVLMEIAGFLVMRLMTRIEP